MRIKIISVLFLASLNISNVSAQKKVFPNSSSIEAITIRLKPGDDLKISLDNFIHVHQIKAACMITCAGSLRQATIRFADRKEADTLKEKFEIVSLTGTLSDSGSHLHISISDETGKTIGGHLKEGSLVYTTAEIVIGILPDVTYERVADSTYGYKELFIKKN